MRERSVGYEMGHKVNDSRPSRLPKTCQLLCVWMETAVSIRPSGGLVENYGNIKVPLGREGEEEAGNERADALREACLGVLTGDIKLEMRKCLYNASFPLHRGAALRADVQSDIRAELHQCTR